MLTNKTADLAFVLVFVSQAEEVKQREALGVGMLRADGLLWFSPPQEIFWNKNRH